jgi:hypothetical protein
MRFLAALAAVLALSGCSFTRKPKKSTFTGTKAQVAAALTALESAAKKADKAKICNQVLSTRLLNRYGGSAKCKAVVGRVLDDADQTAVSMTPQTITLGAGRHPTTAAAAVRSGSGKNATTGTVQFVRQPRGWRIDSFG